VGEQGCVNAERGITRRCLSWRGSELFHDIHRNETAGALTARRRRDPARAV